MKKLLQAETNAGTLSYMALHWALLMITMSVLL